MIRMFFCLMSNYTKIVICIQMDSLQRFIQMEILTNNIFRDTITWEGDIYNLTSFEENNLEKKIVKITDMLGRETKCKNQLLIYFYND